MYLYIPWPEAAVWIITGPPKSPLTHLDYVYIYHSFTKIYMVIICQGWIYSGGSVMIIQTASAIRILLRQSF